MSESGEFLKLKDYSEGQEFIGFLAVKKASTGKTQNGQGKPYLTLTLSDGDIEIPAKQWDYEGPVPKENTVIKVQAKVDSYQGQPQLIIQRWRETKDGDEFSPSQFIPVSPFDIKQMQEQLFRSINELKHEGLKQFVFTLTGEYLDDFSACPAAIYHHQNYIGGLLEHTNNVVKTSKKLALDENVHIDLLVAGAILHDFGKMWDYNWKGCTITMTDEGRLIGHIVNGITIVTNFYNKLRIPELDYETFKLLIHLIASHSGKKEWGSPVEPATKEAVILHQADAFDAQWWKIEKAESETEPGQWTSKIYGINREFFVVPRG